MNTLTLENSLFRFMDGAITDAFGIDDDSTDAKEKMHEGEHQIEEGNVQEGEAKVLEGLGEMLEDQSKSNE